MKKLIFLFLFMLVTSLSYAQSYTTAVGLRGGWGSGITFKHFIGSNRAIEGILSSRWKGFTVTGLYEVNNQTSTRNLDWYYGGGAHIGFWDGYKGHRWFDEGTHTVVGLDGILGIEYTFDEIPLNLSLDWKPAVNFIGNQSLWIDNVALSARFAISR